MSEKITKTYSPRGFRRQLCTFQPPGLKIKGLNAHVSSQCLVNKKGSIFFTLAIVKDAGIDQGMLRLACIKKNATLTEHMSFKKG